MKKIVDQTNGIAVQAPADSSFGQPFKRFPDSFTQADQARLQEQGIAAIRDAVLPAYAHFAKFVRDDYVPHGRTVRFGVHPRLTTLVKSPQRLRYDVISAQYRSAALLVE